MPINPVHFTVSLLHFPPFEVTTRIRVLPTLIFEPVIQWKKLKTSFKVNWLMVDELELNIQRERNT